MPSTSAPRTVLATGGSGGIGRSTSERLAADGMAVGVHYAGNQNRAEQTVDSIRSAGGRAITVSGDVADETAMASAFSALTSEFGGIDVVVNTAGIMLLEPPADFDLDALDRMHRTNIRGTFVVSQLAAQQVRNGVPSSTSPARS